MKPRDSLWHDDPREVETRECTDPDCDRDDHLTLQVRGEHETIQYACEHLVNTVVWHELTLVDHPEPSCPEGCTLTQTRVG